MVASARPWLAAHAASSSHVCVRMQKFVRPGAEVRAPVAPGRPPGIHGDLTIARAVFTRYRACAVLEREREREREREEAREGPAEPSRGLGKCGRGPGEAHESLMKSLGDAQGRPRRGPAGEAWEMLCRGQGEDQRRPRRGPAGEAWEMPCRGPGEAQ